ncbi:MULTISPECIES: DNA-3-methyladenine glycosylase [Fusobacterium]|uniref:DNA-3-methyladenine glycosylase n=1 Tax=Fusobacterium TaxID=848 RepID=UPI00147704E6|nr:MULTISPECIES: DNA-3-methyladenine glycosylase [Fusobacterium]NME35388.1 DNA-3-methyladenine glycosylase [Fusobacterium sp. FSA-380-WT-3A]
MRLKREFYTRDTITVAKELLGKIIVKKREDGEIFSGRIVEVEAYLGIRDKACHSYNDRRTKRTEVMYKEGGYSYVFLIYGMYQCFNVITSYEGNPEAVLIRGIEPLINKEKMFEERKVKKEKDISNGPGKLTKALRITKLDNGIDLTEDKNLWLEDDGYKVKDIVETTRIGIDYAEEDRLKPWRFYIKDNNFVSKK